MIRQTSSQFELARSSLHRNDCSQSRHGSYAREYRVLLINLTERPLMEKLLTSRGFKVDIAVSIDDAELAVRRRPVDLIIVDDVACRESPSGDTLRPLRKADETVPVMIATAARGIEALSVCAQLGGDGVITRPVVAARVVNAVRATLELSWRRRSVQADGDAATRRVIDGYVLRQCLGLGSMGSVYLASKADHGVEFNFALKVLHKPDGEDEARTRELLERFLREAELASRLRHPNIVEIVDYGIEDEEQVPYIVMEYVSGCSLARMIKTGRSTSLAEKVHIIREVGAALDVMHAHAISHRDIKPANILLDRDGIVKLTDFGIARLPNSELTQIVDILGTPAYMAPESFTSPIVDHRADIFSLGVVAYEFLLGKRPFVADTITGFHRRVQRDRPQEPVAIDPLFPMKLQYILGRALKKNPDLRYGCVGEMIRDLDMFIQPIADAGETRDLGLPSFLGDSVEGTAVPVSAEKLASLDDWR